jgi:hypothetical protein
MSPEIFRTATDVMLSRRNKLNRAVDYLNYLSPWNLWENWEDPIDERRLTEKARLGVEQILATAVSEEKSEERLSPADTLSIVVCGILTFVAATALAYVVFEMAS